MKQAEKTDARIAELSQAAEPHRRRRQADHRDRRADQSARAQRHHRGGARRRGRQGLRGRRPARSRRSPRRPPRRPTRSARRSPACRRRPRTRSPPSRRSAARSAASPRSPRRSRRRSRSRAPRPRRSPATSSRPRRAPRRSPATSPTSTAARRDRHRLRARCSPRRRRSRGESTQLKIEVEQVPRDGARRLTQPHAAAMNGCGGHLPLIWVRCMTRRVLGSNGSRRCMVRAVVPQHEVADPPAVLVDELGPRRERPTAGRAARRDVRRRQALHVGIAPPPEIERRRAVDRMAADGRMPGAGRLVRIVGRRHAFAHIAAAVVGAVVLDAASLDACLSRAAGNAVPGGLHAEEIGVAAARRNFQPVQHRGIRRQVG